jgi:hypothetical protein
MLECFRLRLYWQGILHDWHKFLPTEFIPYARYFYGKNSTGISKGRDKTGYYKPTDTGDPAFEMAWLHHIKLAKHHWQYWVIPENPNDKILEIPDKYVQEMVCDWRGAGKAQHTLDNNKFAWFEANVNKMKLHPNTIKKIIQTLEQLK